MAKNDGLINTIFYSILIFTVLAITFMGFQGEQQKAFYKQNQEEFFAVVEKNPKDLDAKDLATIKKTVSYYPNSYKAATVYAQALYQKKEYAESLKYMRKAEEIYPAIIRNPEFLLEHARVLVANGQYTDGKKYLDQAAKISSDAKVDNVAYKMITAINEFQKRGGM